jgi:hypothetical protein
MGTSELINYFDLGVNSVSIWDNGQTVEDKILTKN